MANKSRCLRKSKYPQNNHSKPHPNHTPFCLPASPVHLPIPARHMLQVRPQSLFGPPFKHRPRIHARRPADAHDVDVAVVTTLVAQVEVALKCDELQTLKDPKRWERAWDA